MLDRQTDLRRLALVDHLVLYSTLPLLVYTLPKGMHDRQAAFRSPASELTPCLDNLREVQCRHHTTFGKTVTN